ncbi:MAG: tellurite resistance TerB family protein [Gammaproteobacteria bacterium]|nr:tellurite resistance TerB family protein [Gammaproteobacteria bacterium]MBU1653918.1 tellurite resistance TerB family protein [Gammaproteobacteria bacterium]MBU1960915.1 tellurite resistance TerB family protein [Gammaproteobacteria bacterium]
MTNVGGLLGTLIQGGFNSLAEGRLQNALGPDGLGQMGDILGKVLGGAQGATGNIGDILGNALGNKSEGMGTATLGGVIGGLFGGGGGVGGMARGGVMAALGMLAVNALKDYMAQKAEDPAQAAAVKLTAGLREPENEEEQQRVQDITLLTLKAMINAAKADGQIDAEEMQRITGRAQEGGADEDELALLRQELAAPLDIDAIVNGANGDLQVGAQIYAASLLAIKVDTPAEQAYIQELGEKLGLAEGARGEMHKMLGV